MLSGQQEGNSSSCILIFVKAYTYLFIKQEECVEWVEWSHDLSSTGNEAYGEEEWGYQVDTWGKGGLECYP